MAEGHPGLKPLAGWRNKLHEIIYEADTPAGKLFDVALIIAIAISVAAVMLESIRFIALTYGRALMVLEWVLTVLFTIEYTLRVSCVRRPWRYIFSFYGVIDLMAILPSYLSIFFPAGRVLLIIRVLRMLRVFRVLKLTRYLIEGSMLVEALKASRVKISVFLYAVLTVAVIIGSLMYVIEGEPAGFTSIPVSIYWAIVTLTTVGFGDITPQTPLGQALSAVVMILGYGMIAVPTGIVSVELAREFERATVSTQACQHCSLDGHDIDAKYCKHCGAPL
jgi:voltage-gated potassium channel